MNRLIIFKIVNNILFSTVEKHVSIFVLFIPLIIGWCLRHGGPMGSDRPWHKRCQNFPKTFQNLGTVTLLKHVAVI